MPRPPNLGLSAQLMHTPATAPRTGDIRTRFTRREPGGWTSRARQCGWTVVFAGSGRPGQRGGEIRGRGSGSRPRTARTRAHEDDWCVVRTIGVAAPRVCSGERLTTVHAVARGTHAAKGGPPSFRRGTVQAGRALAGLKALELRSVGRHRGSTIGDLRAVLPTKQGTAVIAPVGSSERKNSTESELLRNRSSTPRPSFC